MERQAETWVRPEPDHRRIFRPALILISGLPANSITHHSSLCWRILHLGSACVRRWYHGRRTRCRETPIAGEATRTAGRKLGPAPRAAEGERFVIRGNVRRQLHSSQTPTRVPVSVLRVPYKTWWYRAKWEEPGWHRTSDRTVCWTLTPLWRLGRCWTSLKGGYQ